MATRTRPRPAVPPRYAPEPTRGSRFSHGVLLGALAASALLSLGWGVATVATQPDPVQQRVAELRAADARRDARQVVTLTRAARAAAERLTPVVAGMYEGDGLSEPIQVRGWRVSVDRVAASFANPPSGGTEVNVARAALRAGVDQLALAVHTASRAAAAPPDVRPDLVGLAERQLSAAVVTWSVGATQLDLLNVRAGHGHVHVFLPSGGTSGALTADPAPEGGAHRER